MHIEHFRIQLRLVVPLSSTISDRLAASLLVIYQLWVGEVHLLNSSFLQWRSSRRRLRITLGLFSEHWQQMSSGSQWTVGAAAARHLVCSLSDRAFLRMHMAILRIGEPSRQPPNNASRSKLGFWPREAEWNAKSLFATANGCKPLLVSAVSKYST